MKVLYVTTHFNIGGISNYILTLSRALKAKGVEPIVASSGGNLEAELANSGIRHKRLNIDTKFEFGPKAVSSGFAVARLVKDDRIDIIHAHTRVSQVASSIASRATGIPFVTTCHGYFKVRMRKIFDTWGVRVIAISDAVKKHLRDDFGIKEERIRLVYSGVDIARFSKKYSDEEIKGIKMSIGLNSGPVIGTIGRLSSVKGQRFLIEAMKDVVLKRPDAQALIVGDGDEEAVLKNLAKSLGIEESVRFIGSDPDIHKFLSMMDVFVFPSVKEGLGIALLEALASGRSCVASNVGGISDIIENGSSGLLVPVGDSRAISTSVLNLLRDEGLRRRMGEKGREIVETRFSLDLMAEQVADLYLAALKSRPLGRG